MKTRAARPARLAMITFLCFQLLMPILPRAAEARDEVVDLKIGKPSVWSLAQAHYFLARMHDKNRALATRFPDEDALDPNRPDASRLELVRTLLGIQAKFDESLGVKNEMALERFRDQQARRDGARVVLETRRADLQRAENELLALEEQVAALTVEDQLADAARGTAPATEADLARKRNLATLKARRDAKKAERDRLASEVSSLTTAANADLETPELSTAAPADLPTALPSSEAFTGFITKALGDLNTPRFSASMALDNFVGMQYEIISKQLSLLRDEVGPDERVIFLELPASIYTVDKKADDYIAQVTWTVKGIYDKMPEPGIQKDELCRDLRDQGRTPAETVRTLNSLEGTRVHWRQGDDSDCINAILGDAVQEVLPQAAKPVLDKIQGRAKREEAEEWLRDVFRHWAATAASAGRGQAPVSRPEGQSVEVPENREVVRSQDEEAEVVEEQPVEVAEGQAVAVTEEEAVEASQEQAVEVEGRPDELQAGEAPFDLESSLKEYLETDVNVDDLMYAIGDELGEDRMDGGSRPYPITLEMLMKAPVSAAEGRVRALELIPRQSALNVNESHGEVKNFFAQGIVGLLNGLGLNVAFQKQKELFERFLQQEMFASAYGKGKEEFGWTFGPLPGSRRIAPGQRTTYAVLAVPKNALGLELEASGKYFRRNKSPGRAQPIAPETFQVLIPGERTEQFWVEGISYTPVRKGQRVTALLRGSYFSPQLGVLVNGAPLRPVISIARVGGIQPAASESGSTSPGEFEITNSREIALSFTLDKDFVGTPILTLITPERSTTINSFKMEINFAKELESLKNASLREPMFVEDFSLQSELQPMTTDELPKDLRVAADCQLKDGFELRRLIGTGLLPRAEITVHGTALKTVPLKELAREVCTPSDRPLASQLSTHAYVLYFAKPANEQRWKVRYQQPTRQSFDDREVVHPQPAGILFASELRHYERGPRGGPAEAHLTFTSPQAVQSVELVHPRRAGSCHRVQSGGRNKFRVQCDVPRKADGGERDFITVRVVMAGGEEQFVDFKLPARPRIASLRNPRTGKASGFADEEPVVFIEGAQLQGVTGVFFGAREAKFTAPADPEVLSVQVPRIELAKGEEASVPVFLQMGSDERLGSGIFYTYFGAPLPKVVVWPYPPPPKFP